MKLNRQLFKAAFSTFNRQDELALKSLVAKAKVLERNKLTKESEIQALARRHQVPMTPALMSDLVDWAGINASPETSKQPLSGAADTDYAILPRSSGQLNVLGEPLQHCSEPGQPTTGYFRTGCCETDDGDRGVHTVCVVLSEKFLAFSKSVGNDLSTPMPMFGFPGLKPGDQWCLCAARWLQAFQLGVAPKVKVRATNKRTLGYVPLEALLGHAIDYPPKK